MGGRGGCIIYSLFTSGWYSLRFAYYSVSARFSGRVILYPGSVCCVISRAIKHWPDCRLHVVAQASLVLIRHAGTCGSMHQKQAFHLYLDSHLSDHRHRM